MAALSLDLGWLLFAEQGSVREALIYRKRNDVNELVINKSVGDFLKFSSKGLLFLFPDI